jgi:hypothetical protein
VTDGVEHAVRDMARLTAAVLAEPARSGEQWRVILSEDNTMMVRSLAKRGYLDVLKRHVPLFRLSALGREGLHNSPQREGKKGYRG